MGKIVGVSFRRCGKIYKFDSGELEIYRGDWVVAETVRGLELGQVMYDKVKQEGSEEEKELTVLNRKATTEDFKFMEKNHFKAAEAFRVGLEKIRKHGLPMKLVDVEYTLDENKIVFYFSADGRVDFRALVRDLAAIFRKRIELHQIGVRDVAKMLGGIGPCGRTVCCATFLTNFNPVSIRMAKEQNLSLNPVKISGACGRLMCCLRYEHDQYRDLAGDLPEIDASVTLDEGVGRVVDLNIPKQTALIEMPSKARLEYEGSSFRKVGEGRYEIHKSCKPFQKKNPNNPFPG
ncbi:MAG: stage 0 sporulation family protein [Candidatus Eremiobacteraeota bacterium]|nr:stage 0 sporulation family protein [Candidatus Eremiobacteraeota bacterium]